MPSTIEKLSTTRVKLTIQVPFSELTPTIRKVYKDLAGRVAIPGFRKGHVPPAMIDQRIGRGAVLSEAVNEILPEVYAKAIEEHELMPLGQPEVDIEKLEEDKEVVFTAEVDVRPEFDLPQASSIEVTVDVPDDIEKDVDARVDMLRERFAETAEVSRAARLGDQVSIDLKGSQNGEVLPDATAEEITYVVGSGGMLEGLDDAVTGLTAGESKTFASTLVGGGHEGEKAEIEVTIVKVSERTLPEVDDSFAQLVSEFDTVGEMRGDLRSSVRRMLVIQQVTQAREQVLDAILEKTSFDLPEGLVAREVENRQAQITEQLKAAGLTLEAYLERVGNLDERTPEEFQRNIEKSVEKGVRTEIVLSKIAEMEEVRVDQDDLTNFIFQKAQENGTSPEQELQHMQSHNHVSEWMVQIRQSKALDAFVARSSVKDASGAKVDVASILSKREVSE